MGSNELRNKPENTTLVGTEWLYTQEDASPYEVQKMKFQTILDRIEVLSFRKVGSSIIYEEEYIETSESFPWYCLSKPTEILTTANYPVEFINARRAKKWTHDQAGATPVSSFGGVWSTNEFTLDNNATNIAFLAELLEDWEFHGKPTSGWRILFDGTTELDITNIVLSTRKITTAANGSGPSIEIYTNRVKGSTTSCKHFTEAGLADYQAGGGKIAGALRRDKGQGWQLGAIEDGSGARNAWARADNRDLAPSATTAVGNTLMRMTTAFQGGANMLKAANDGTNGDPRTGSETQAKSATVFKYLFVGSYEA
jgi:hypothetical protein